MKDGLWYFAHPYTVKDRDGKNIYLAEEANFNLCCMRSLELLKIGYSIYSPIAHTHPMHVREPEFLKRGEYLTWINLDNKFIANTKFKGIIMAPEWEKSNGCTDERNHFKSKGLTIKLYSNIIKNETINASGI